MHADMRALRKDIGMLRDELLSVRGSTTAGGIDVVPLSKNK
jgi:hypothetical protein